MFDSKLNCSHMFGAAIFSSCTKYHNIIFYLYNISYSCIHMSLTSKTNFDACKYVIHT